MFDEGIFECFGRSGQLKDQEGKIISKGNMNITSNSLELGHSYDFHSWVIELNEEISESEFLSGRPFIQPGITQENTKTHKQTEKNAINSKFRPLTQLNQSQVKVSSLPSSSFVTCSVLYDLSDPLTFCLNSDQIQGKDKNCSISPIVLDSFLTRCLRPHQREGIQFLFDCVMGRKNPNFFGSILADEMVKQRKNEKFASNNKKLTRELFVIVIVCFRVLGRVYRLLH